VTRFAWLACAAALCACGGAAGADDPAGVPFRVVARGSAPATGHDPLVAGTLARDPAQARRRLRSLRLAAAPNVDYARRSLVVLVGRSGDTGSRLAVRRLALRAGRLRATVALNPPSGMTGQTESRPYTLLSVPRAAVASASGPVAVDLRG
jgi:hypothetical protein